VLTCLFFFFFFSSRRRHTRFSRDWSSDVCSSDLPPQSSVGTMSNMGALRFRDGRLSPGAAGARCPDRAHASAACPPPATTAPDRSEERRVGKECRSRWSPSHGKEEQDGDGEPSNT